MELTREAYQTIVKNISNKSDLCRLARVSKAFQRAVEYVLYNTIYMRDSQRTMDLCNTLAASGRLASLVNTFTLFIVDGDGGEEDRVEGAADLVTGQADGALPEFVEMRGDLLEEFDGEGGRRHCGERVAWCRVLSDGRCRLVAAHGDARQ